MKGFVRKFSGPKSFGFIKGFDDKGIIISENIFYHVDSVNVDPIGRRRPVVGSEVEFDLVRLDDGRFKAENITDINALAVDPTSHREWSFIKSWKPADVGAGLAAIGWLERESGDAVVLLPANIQDFGLVEPRLCVGLWVEHSVVRSGRNQYWLATDAIIRLPEDSEASDLGDLEPPDELSRHFLSVAELPLDKPEPERPEPGHVYLPSERKLSLKEIIARRSVA